jgi:hypothetical protein
VEFGRHTILRGWRGDPCRFESGLRHHHGKMRRDPKELRFLHLKWLRIGCGWLRFIQSIYCFPVAARDQVAVNIHRHLNTRMSQLLLHIDGTLTITQYWQRPRNQPKATAGKSARAWRRRRNAPSWRHYDAGDAFTLRGSYPACALNPDSRDRSSVLLSPIACSLQDEDLRAVHETVSNGCGHSG